LIICAVALAVHKLLKLNELKEGNPAAAS